MKNYLGWIAAAFSSLIAVILFVIIIIQASKLIMSQETLFESEQGEYISYNSNDPYKLYIIKQNQPLSSNYIILVSSKQEKLYGHILSYIDPSPVSKNDIKQTRVIWSIEGIEMTFVSGHKLYIPKERFTAGR
jgi:hypothetical protein